VKTEDLARFLIGKSLVLNLARGRVSGRIVETEAYPPGDASSRAFTGQSEANRSLYLCRGHAFVYLIYGLYYLLNVVSEPSGIGAAVLLRSLEPLEGIDIMEENRGTAHVLGLTRGPGRLTKAFGIDRRYDGLDLCGDGPLWLGTGVRPVGSIAATTRIGLTKEVHRLLRFYEEGNPFVSGSSHARNSRP
jgi:DNA-3-methyladenine glycosylase